MQIKTAVSYHYKHIRRAKYICLSQQDQALVRELNKQNSYTLLVGMQNFYRHSGTQFGSFL